MTALSVHLKWGGNGYLKRKIRYQLFFAFTYIIKYVTWPVLPFITYTIHHCQPFRPEPYMGQQDNHHEASIYIRFMASRHPIFNFLLTQSNIDKRSRDPTNQHLKPKLS